VCDIVLRCKKLGAEPVQITTATFVRTDIQALPVLYVHGDDGLHIRELTQFDYERFVY